MNLVLFKFILLPRYNVELQRQAKAVSGIISEEVNRLPPYLPSVKERIVTVLRFLTRGRFTLIGAVNGNRAGWRSSRMCCAKKPWPSIENMPPAGLLFTTAAWDNPYFASSSIPMR